MKPDQHRLFDALDATWPAYKKVEAGPWVLREGAGGGKRVSAASLRGRFDPEDDISAAEEAMRILGQTPLFMIREGDEALDARLAERGYSVVDPVNSWLCPVHALTDKPVPRVMTFAVWEPLAIMRDIWAEAGIGPARLAVMDRAKGPKTGLLGRLDDSPAGVAFVAADDDVAMLHALDVRPKFRKRGLAGWMMRAAAFWAADQGIEWLSVVCTQENTGANALYRGLGMELVGQYHYRILEGE